MRILHFIHSLDPATGGPVEGLRQRCTIYRMNGHEVELATLDSPESVARWDFPANVVGLGRVGEFTVTRAVRCLG